MHDIASVVDIPRHQNGGLLLLWVKAVVVSSTRQQRLYFLPEPHGQGSFRPTFMRVAMALVRFARSCAIFLSSRIARGSCATASSCRCSISSAGSNFNPSRPGDCYGPSFPGGFCARRVRAAATCRRQTKYTGYGVTCRSGASSLRCGIMVAVAGT